MSPWWGLPHLFVPHLSHHTGNITPTRRCWLQYFVNSLVGLDAFTPKHVTDISHTLHIAFTELGVCKKYLVPVHKCSTSRIMNRTVEAPLPRQVLQLAIRGECLSGSDFTDIPRGWNMLQPLPRKCWRKLEISWNIQKCSSRTLVVQVVSPVLVHLLARVSS